MAGWKQFRQLKWLRALALVGAMWLGASAASAQTTFVTPPNQGMVTGPGSGTYTWTAPHDGYMTFGDGSSGAAGGASLQTVCNGVTLSDPNHVVALAGDSCTMTVTVNPPASDYYFSWDFHPTPPNDKFADAIDVTTVPNPDPSAAPNTASSGSFTGDGSWAMLEPGDPMTNPDVWYKWTAPVNGQAVWGVSGIGGGTADAVIYQGTALTNLMPTGTPFWAVAGTTYYIAISRGGTYGVSWTLHPSPANDNFANAVDLSAAPSNPSGGTLNGNDAYDTTEPGDPVAQPDVWYRWMAPASGVVTLGGTADGGAAYFNAVAYRGTSLASLVNVSGTAASSLNFQATTGTSYYIAVNASGRNFNFTWSFQAAPTITNISPGSGLAGATITLTGTKFTGATAVNFGTISAPTFTVVSDTQIKVTVPTGVTSGAISVTTPAGTATSATVFTVLQPPTITGFTPTTGPVGTVVTLTGTGLSGASVTFGTKTAAVDTLLSSDTKLVCTVPVGAATEAVKVTTSGGSVTSATIFTVTAGDGISGHVFAKNGKTPLKGVRVFLIKNGDLAALLSSAASPDIVTATTDASGAYHLSGQAAGTYIITPLVPGTAFTSSHGAAPVSLLISGVTSLDFTASATDSTGPTVTLVTPQAKDYATLPTAMGTIADKESGPLAVVVGLYRFQNGSIVGIYDWRAQTFVAANSQDSGVFKTVPTNGPNWSLTLPALAPSSYRLSVIGVNKAFEAGTNGGATPVSITRDFSLSGGGSATDSSAPTVSLKSVNGLTLATVPPGTSALTVSSLLKVEVTATDNKGGSGVAKVNLYLFRNLKTVIAGVAYSAEFWNGTSWVSVTVSPLSKLSALPSLSTTIGTTTGGVTSWSRTSGLPQDSGNYNLAAVAYDKAGNQSDYLSIFIGARTITVKAAPKSVSVALSTATAQAATSSITIRCLGALDADSASDASHYSVTVNGVPVRVESAGYNAAMNTVTLALPDGALHSGDAVTVQGNGLSDAKGHAIAGSSGTLTAH